MSKKLAKVFLSIVTVSAVFVSMPFPEGEHTFSVKTFSVLIAIFSIVICYMLFAISPFVALKPIWKSLIFSTSVCMVYMTAILVFAFLGKIFDLHKLLNTASEARLFTLVPFVLTLISWTAIDFVYGKVINGGDT